MRHALSVASECAPLIKTGGLADVVGALPGALAAEGWALRTLLPGYPSVLRAVGAGKTVWKDKNLFGGPAKLIVAEAAGLDFLILDAPHLYDRTGSIYLDDGGQDYADNPERFAALSWVAAYLAANGIGDWIPEALHLHDWQAALTPWYIKEMGARAGTLLTIHNVAFHGIAPAARLNALRLPANGFTSDGFEFWGQINMLKAGIVAADKISTVSPTYARELTTPEFGMGLEGVIDGRQADLCGILNGIDLEAWNPATDTAITTHYHTPRGKKKAKARLEKEFGLPAADGPLCIVVSRLTEQKGLDLLLDALPALVDRGGRLALLGSGDRALETAWLRAADAHPFVSVRIGYDEDLSHRMFAGADAVLVPSRFEPCGLTQLYGLRYGTVPVVALTGGLADTVIPANTAAMRDGVATGLQFHPVTARALANSLMDLRAIYADAPQWSRIQRNGMKHPVGWDVSARAYAELYDSLSTPA
ncbi:MAG: glycogen synthase GlgA [Silicimonas sp.]|nr:glycogen synthase GlgA [Silicimonas sp.]